MRCSKPQAAGVLWPALLISVGHLRASAASRLRPSRLGFWSSRELALACFLLYSEDGECECPRRPRFQISPSSFLPCSIGRSKSQAGTQIPGMRKWILLHCGTCYTAAGQDHGYREAWRYVATFVTNLSPRFY